MAWILLPFCISMSPFLLRIEYVYSFIFALKILNLFTISILFIKRKIGLTIFEYIIFGYIYIWGLSCIVNGQDLFAWCVEIANLFFYIIILKYSMYRKKDLKAFIAVLTLLLGILFLSNIVGLIFYPTGIWITVSSSFVEARNNFLGLDNQITPIMLLALIIFCMFGHYFSKKMSLFLIILIYINCIFLWSATAIVSLALLLIIFMLNLLNSKLFNIKLILLMVIIIMVLITFFNYQLLSDWILKILDKEATFSGRFILWNKAIKMFLLKPIIGYGRNTMEGLSKGSHAHSFYINIMLQSGVIGFIIFLSLIRISCVNFYRNIKRKLIPKTDSAFITGCIGALLIAFLMEVYSLHYTVIILYIAYYSDTIFNPKST